MKNTYLKISSLILSGALLFTACDTDLDINKDPDLLSPDQVPMSAEMPAAETGIAAAAGAYFGLIGGFWSQYWTQSAIANQYKQIDDYTFGTTQSMNNGAWSAMYDALLDARNIKVISEANNNWNYYLIATTLEVYASQILTDMYGAIPYSEANNAAILNPKFDSEEKVYDMMVTDLADALSKDLSESPIENTPGATDFIFGGDMTKWTAFANTLMLKIHLRQSEVRPSVAETGIQGLINSGVSFLNEDAAITQYADEDSKSNPLFETDRRQLNVGTNLRASMTMGSYLNDMEDPRLASFYDGTEFQMQGDYENGSSTSSVVLLTATAPYYFMSLAESKFLQAEADARYMGGANAAALYDAGVTAAFAQTEDDGSALLSGAYAYPAGSLDENLEAIITQKWISLFPGNGFEAFIEHNRTGYPLESTVPQDDATYVSGQFAYSIEGKTDGKFPKRIEIGNDERQRNTNAPAVIDITTAVWYDAN